MYKLTWTALIFRSTRGILITFYCLMSLSICVRLNDSSKLYDVRESPGNSVKVIVSTGNVGFLITRLALLFGWFNYGRRGILDLTHTRLFTFGTLRNLFEQAGYQIEES